MSIERNLGNVERVLRLLLGGALMALAITSPGLNGIEWFVGIISTCLILNGVFSRCYLWYVLDIDTHNTSTGSCSQDVKV
jgi:hypothetical protein